VTTDFSVGANPEKRVILPPSPPLRGRGEKEGTATPSAVSTLIFLQTSRRPAIIITIIIVAESDFVTQRLQGHGEALSQKSRSRRRSARQFCFATEPSLKLELAKQASSASLTSFRSPNFQEPPARSWPYVQLVDGIGKYTLSVEVHDLREGTVIARMPPVEIEFAERITKAVLMFAAPPLRLPHEGSYDFVVLADDQEIDRQKFEASSPGGIEGGGHSVNQ
jgi:hypothetical protein